MTWHPDEIFKAWNKIHHNLYEAMKDLPHETLQFLAFRASDQIIRSAAAGIRDWRDNRETLPDWGWFTHAREERLRCHV
jgi:hypothetical protein